MQGRVRIAGALLLLLILTTASCGDDPPLENSPWLITLDSTDNHAFENRVFRAHRVRDGKAEHVLLDSVKTAVSWSPSGEWMAYGTQLPTGYRSVSIQRFDGDRWHEPQPLKVFETERASVSSYAWSPTSDQLLYVTSSSSGSLDADVAVAVATPRDDGSIATKVLDPRDSGQAQWAPTGDRILLWGKRMAIVDVRAGIDLEGPWPAREIAPPAGMVFDHLQAPSEVNLLGDGTFSADGRWLNFVLKRDDAPSKLLYALSATGEEPRGFENCPLPRDAFGERCWPDSWLPSGAAFFAQCYRSDGASFEAWSPATGAHSSLGNVIVLNRLGPASSRLLTMERSSGRIAVVDMRDVASPVFIDVPTTEQPSFVRTFESDDGRWLVLAHQDDLHGWFDIVDLRAAPPWQAREIYRTDGNIKDRNPSWSPGGSFIWMHHRAEADKPARIGRIDLETGSQSTFENPPWESPDGRRRVWSWYANIAYDDRTATIDRNGTLAVWRMDRPKESAIVLDGVPAWDIVTWVPDKRARSLNAR